MKTTQKEATAMEIMATRNRIFNLFDWQKVMTVKERQEINDKVDDLIADTFYSQLSQIKEEIEKEKKLCTPERKDSNEDYERGRIAAFEISEIIVSSHMEEKGQEEKHE